MNSDYRPMRLDEIDDSLQREIKEKCGVDVETCMECGKCSGGCSNGHIFDFTPRKIVQLVKLNAEDTLIAMDSLWICLSCHLCVDRCPSGIDTARILDYMRQKAYRKGVTTRPKISLFHELMMSSVLRSGRVSELPLLMKYNWKTRQYINRKDAVLGLKMLLKGKLRLFSPGVKDREEVRRIFSTGNSKPTGGRP
jgi:heterodisulfide reductase subunit C